MLRTESTDTNGNRIVIDDYGEDYKLDIHIYQALNVGEYDTVETYRMYDATKGLNWPDTVIIYVTAENKKVAIEIGKAYLGVDKVRTAQFNTF